jgi:hypothetical protein
VPGRCPCIYSSWELWRKGALPAIGGRLAAAKVRHTIVQQALLVVLLWPAKAQLMCQTA